MLSRVIFGPALPHSSMETGEHEEKDAFLARARLALLQLGATA